MEISVTGYIYSKESELFSDCADRYAVNSANHKFAISDGVTKSFFPSFWAETLVNEFVDSGKDIISENELISKAQKKWHALISEIVQRPGIKWFTRNAFNRGEAGLATLVTLQLISEEQSWRAEALGDTFLFFVPENKTTNDQGLILLSSMPQPIQFDNFPDYYTSIGGGHNGIKKDASGTIVNGTFYLMTDALAEWFINGKEDATRKIEKLKNQSDFEQLVQQERASRKLDNDDSAILIIKIEKVAERSEIQYRKIDISRIEDLIENEQKSLKKQAERESQKQKGEKSQVVLTRNEIEEKTGSTGNESSSTPPKQPQKTVNETKETNSDPPPKEDEAPKYSESHEQKGEIPRVGLAPIDREEETGSTGNESRSTIPKQSQETLNETKETNSDLPPEENETPKYSESHEQKGEIPQVGLVPIDREEKTGSTGSDSDSTTSKRSQETVNETKETNSDPPPEENDTPKFSESHEQKGEIPQVGLAPIDREEETGSIGSDSDFTTSKQSQETLNETKETNSDPPPEENDTPKFSESHEQKGRIMQIGLDPISKEGEEVKAGNKSHPTTSDQPQKPQEIQLLNLVERFFDRIWFFFPPEKILMMTVNNSIKISKRQILRRI